MRSVAWWLVGLSLGAVLALPAAAQETAAAIAADPAAELAGRVETLERERDELAGLMADQAPRLAAQAAEIAALRESQRFAADAAAAALAEEQERGREAQRRIQALEAERDRAHMDAAQLQKQLDEAAARPAAATPESTNRLLALHAEFSQAQARHATELEELRRQIDTLSSERDASRTQVAGLRKRLDELLARQPDVAAAAAPDPAQQQAAADAAEQQARIAALQTENAELQKRLLTLGSLQTGDEQARAALLRERDGLLAVRISQAQQLADLQSELARLRSAQGAATSERDQLRIQALTTERDNARTEAAGLQERLAEVRRQAAELSARESQRLRDADGARAAELAGLRDSLAGSRQQQAQAAAQLEALRRELAAERLRAQQATAAAEAERAEVAALNGKLGVLDAAVRKLPAGQGRTRQAVDLRSEAGGGGRVARLAAGVQVKVTDATRAAEGWLGVELMGGSLQGWLPAAELELGS